VFLLPIREKNILTGDEITALFSTVEEIYELTKIVLSKLEEIYVKEPEAEHYMMLVDIFLHSVSGFRCPH
jgi:hypothetical protein